MTEATVGDGAPGVKQIIEVHTGLRGIPVGLLCRAVDVRDEIRVSKETWSMWKAAGLRTVDLGSDTELVLTDKLHEWAASEPTLPIRPSRLKKAARKTQRKKGA